MPLAIAPPRRRLAAIAAGGVAGAAVRWAVLEACGEVAWAWPILALNVIGSFVLGALLAEEQRNPGARIALADFGAIGFCGGLTTFSTFAVEVATLLDDGQAPAAIAYGTASVVGAIAAVVAGAASNHRWRASGLPVEGAP